MKRMLPLILAAALLLGAVGCGALFPDNVPDTGTHTPDVNLPPSDTTEDPQPPATDDPTEPAPDGGEVEQPPETQDPPAPPDEGEVPDDPDEPEEPEEPVEYVRVVDPYAPMVALTFDDGPHEQFSVQILDVLERYHSVATFFEVGYNAVLYPEILVRMAELGCEIASHTYYHHDLTTLSQDAMLTDLAKLDKIICDATGQMPTLVRPPYGAVNSMVKYKSGRAMILWTVDTKDWMYRDAQTLIEYIQNYGDLDGEIVLMHSIHGSTAAAMETVIPWLIEQGYQLVTVSELMAYYYGELLEANHYYNQNFFAKRDRTEYPIELPAEPMPTDIPPFNIVPVTPMPKPEDETPPDTPEVPPEQPTDPTPPAEGEETPSDPPEEPLPPQEDTASGEAPDGGDGIVSDTPPPTDESPDEGGETPPSEDETVPPPEGDGGTAQ